MHPACTAAVTTVILVRAAVVAAMVSIVSIVVLAITSVALVVAISVERMVVMIAPPVAVTTPVMIVAIVSVAVVTAVVISVIPAVVVVPVVVVVVLLAQQQCERSGAQYDRSGLIIALACSRGHRRGNSSEPKRSGETERRDCILKACHFDCSLHKVAANADLSLTVNENPSQS